MEPTNMLPEVPPAVNDVLESARATKSIVDQTANLLLMGTFPGNACIQIGNSFQFLKQFSEKIGNEIAALEQKDAVTPEVVNVGTTIPDAKLEVK